MWMNSPFNPYCGSLEGRTQNEMGRNSGGFCETAVHDQFHAIVVPCHRCRMGWSNARPTKKEDMPQFLLVAKLVPSLNVRSLNAWPSTPLARAGTWSPTMDPGRPWETPGMASAVLELGEMEGKSMEIFILRKATCKSTIAVMENQHLYPFVLWVNYLPAIFPVS